MENPHLTILISLAFFLIVQGIAYAIQIDKTPAAHGWTWLSVVTGTLMIDSGATFAMYIILDSSGGLLDHWPILYVPSAVLILVGGSMAIAQVLKNRSANSKIEEIKEKHNFDAE